MFKDIRSDSPGRLELWEANKAFIRELLEEVLKDVFDGKGQIYEDHENFVRFNKPFTKPNLLIVTEGKCMIGVCTDSATTFQVRVNMQKGEAYFNVLKENIPTSLAILLRRQMG